MNGHDAMMAAADSIDAEHAMFNFGSTEPPDHKCGTPACALGWTLHHLHNGKVPIEKRLWWNSEKFYAAIGIFPDDDGRYDNHHDGDDAFYRRMEDLNDGDTESWKGDPTLAAQSLRNYATKYLGDDS